MVRRLAAAILCSMALTTHADTALFDFDGPDSPINTNTHPPFALTRSGLTATFSSGFEPFSVETASSMHIATMTGNVLTSGRPDPVFTFLTIGLSAPQTSVDLLFWFPGPQGDVLRMILLDGNTLVGSTSASGSIPPGFLYPEGELSFSGAAFDQIQLFGSPVLQSSFAIDDLRLEPAVPITEPGIGWLLATGLLAVGGIARRRRTGLSAQGRM